MFRGVALGARSSLLAVVAVCLFSPIASCSSSADRYADAFDAGKDGGRIGVQVSALGEAPEANCVWAQGPTADYWFCPTSRSWQASRDKCIAVGLDLPAITADGTNTFLKNEIGGTSWIGATDSSTEDVWRWAATGVQFWQGDEDGGAVAGAYSKWSFGQPNNYFNQDCATMSSSDARWDDTSCTNTHRYICQSFVDQCTGDPLKTAPGQCGCGTPDVDSDDDGTADCDDECPDDPLRTQLDCTPDSDCELVAYGSSQYFFCDPRRTYEDAKDRCEAIGWNLVRVDSSGEKNFLAGRLFDDAWGGATDLAAEGQWFWDIGGNQFWSGGVNGTAVGGLYSDWDFGDPDNLGGQDCLQIQGDGEFIDDSCGDTEEYICEDMCPADTAKAVPGVCGCGVADANTDGDSQLDCNETCDTDPNKLAPGVCGCGVADTNTDGDSQLDCNETCDTDPNKLAPGVCGCGVADTNTDGDSQLDCNETCDTDPNKLQPGVCGCGVADTNTDGDSQLDCNETCDSDPDKLEPGVCGCGVADTNTDGDSQPDCNETCDTDPAKLAPGICGCAVQDVDTDGDAVLDCNDGCPNDPAKTAPGACGCGILDAADDPSCDGLDQDCDGSTDEDFGGSPTQCGVGACAAAGTTLCLGGEVVDGCEPGTGADSDPTCDGVDDDCDGTVDENCGGESSCGNGADDDADDLIDCDDDECAETCALGSACAEDADCTALGLGPEATCLLDVPGGYCVRPCGAPSSCPTDAFCLAERDVCVLACDAANGCERESFSCLSLPESDSLFCRAGCSTDCPAPTACEPVFQTCQLCAEQDLTCDGVDDDCDGVVDDDFPSEETSCTGDNGCVSFGSTECLEGVVVDTCAPGAPSLLDYTCNGLDDDCDGEVDETYFPYATTCGTGACRSTAVSSCQNGVEVDNCSPGVPAPSDGTCNAVDDDCDGAADENYAPSPTTCGIGACASTGLRTCVGGAELDSCASGTGLPTDGSCNGIDNDCDGAVDEDYEPALLTCGDGSCLTTGTTSCESGQIVEECIPGTPAAQDTSCDGGDDDCDGAVDEDFVSEATTCGIGACARTGSLDCIEGTSIDTCTAGEPATGDACNSADDDCDGALDEDAASDDGNPCTSDGCDPTTGQPTHTLVPNGTACSDGNDCNGADSCRNSTCPFAPAGMVGFWKGEGNCDNAVTAGSDFCNFGLGFVPGVVGQAMSFDGNGFVSLATSGSAINSLSAGTFELWLKPTNDACYPVFQRKASEIAEFSLSIGGCQGDSTRLVTLVQKTPSGTLTAVYATTNRSLLFNGAFHHLAMTVDGATSRLYVDGNELPLTAIGGPAIPSGWQPPTSGNVVLGYPLSDGPQRFVGLMDEVSVYGRALSPAEIQAIYAAGSSGKCGAPGMYCLPTSPTGGLADDGNPCTLEICDPLLGAHPPAPEGTACSDPVPCSQGGQCDDTGDCVGAFVPPDSSCDGLDDDCDGKLDEAFEPTCVDGFDRTACILGAVEPRPCDDGNACNGLEHCFAEACVAGEPLPAADDGNDCTLDVCDPIYGEMHQPTAQGVPCATGGSCDGTGECGAAVQELLQNGSFEEVPNTEVGAGLMPVAWRAISGLTNTQSEDGSYGQDSGQAPDGLRFLQTFGGGTRFGQVLRVPLQPGAGYDVSAMILFGTYRVALQGPTDSVTVATLSGGGQWAVDTEHFIAPADARGRFALTIEHIGSPGSAYYVDDVHLGTSNGVDTCVPNVAVDDGNPCTEDSCETTSSAAHEPTMETLACADGDPCTLSDTCTDTGECRGTFIESSACTAMGGPCTEDAQCAALGPEAYCLTERDYGVPGGTCTTSCAEAGTCPSGSACWPLLQTVIDEGGQPISVWDYVRAGATNDYVCMPSCEPSGVCPRDGACVFPFDPSGTPDRVCRFRCSADSDCGTGAVCEDHYCAPPPSQETSCTNGRDEDRDGTTDCADADCLGSAGCGESCRNNLDDDGDGAKDCEDSECSEPCEICSAVTNGYAPGVDEDLDGLNECTDPDCGGCAEDNYYACVDRFDNDLDGFADCADPECAAIGLTDCQESFHCSDGIDNDADSLIDCFDPSCANLEPCSEDTPARCSDGVDNNHDGTLDCADAGCHDVGSCAENTEVRCHDGLDNDQDGAMDCADSDCFFSPSTGGYVRTCTEAGTLNCQDGLDNDEDGTADCGDPSCACHERCDDGVDNDSNGLADCRDDFNCLNAPECTEACGDEADGNGDGRPDCLDPRCAAQESCSELACSDGLDDDLDGVVDCNDPECSEDAACPEACDNSVDDDGNGAVDCADVDCIGTPACDESVQCTDGVDNDLDGLADCADDECANGPSCSEAAFCIDGLDNDGDGFVDCADEEDCASYPTCYAPTPEICGNSLDDDHDSLFDCADLDCDGLGACGIVPPDPASVAPALDLTQPTTLAASLEFLYSGPDPVQRGVVPGTIEPERVAVLRGKVTDRAGDALAGVRVAVLNEAELGRTYTRADGHFDLVVNGGVQWTITFTAPGFLEVQRKAQPDWQDPVVVPTVVLTPASPVATPVTLSASAEAQLVRGTVETDADGSRQGTLFVPSGTGALVTLPDGTVVPAEQFGPLNVRVTELTVGAMGGRAMPAELPPASAFTYAMDLSADDTTRVEFSQPLPYYIENFLDFAVGTEVPLGYYDPDKGHWIASDNGVVLKILDVVAGVAMIDTNGDDAADSAGVLATWGITEEEQRTLGSTYAAGAELWRVLIGHFSYWDANMGMWPPDDAESPDPILFGPPPGPPPPEPPICKATGSIVECQKGVLGEQIAVPGTDTFLAYRSDRNRGANKTVTVTLGSPERLSSGSFYMVSAEFQPTHGPSARFAWPQGAVPPSVTYTWSGVDSYGRPVQGPAEVEIRVKYHYQCVYTAVTRFGYNGNGIPLDVVNNPRRTIGDAESSGAVGSGGAVTDPLEPACSFNFTTTMRQMLNTWDFAEVGLGGWSLSNHHVYDREHGVLLMGDGTTVSAPEHSFVVTREDPSNEGTMPSQAQPIAGPDGVYLATTVEPSGYTPFALERIRDGVHKSYVPISPRAPTIEGLDGLSLEALRADPDHLNAPSIYQVPSFAPDGQLYFSIGYGVIFRLGLDGIFHHVSGNGNFARHVVEGPDAKGLSEPYTSSVVVGTDGKVYGATHGWPDEPQIYMVDTDGAIRRLIGYDPTIGVTWTSSCDIPFGEQALGRNVRLCGDAYSLLVGRDGVLYFSDGYRVYRLDSGGMVRPIAGTLSTSGGVQRSSIGTPRSLVMDSLGALQFQNTSGQVFGFSNADGGLRQVAGPVPGAFPTGTRGASPFEGRPALGTDLGRGGGIALAPDGHVYAVHRSSANNGALISLQSPAAPISKIPLSLKSPSASEIFVFDDSGRHLRTLHADTGALLSSFAYDAEGRLTTATDAFGRETQVERDASGRLTAIVAPHGQRTALVEDADGYLSEVKPDPDAPPYVLGYAGHDGLLTTMSDPLARLHEFEYEDGRLVRDSSPDGRELTLTSTEVGRVKTTAISETEGGTTTYTTDYSTPGTTRAEVHFPDGTANVSVRTADGKGVTTKADGTTITVSQAPDPVYGMVSPITSAITKLPSGLTRVVTRSSSAVLADPHDRSSWTSRTTTSTVAGRAWTETLDRATRTQTTTSPEGRTTVSVIRETGQPDEVRAPGRALLSFDYDAEGRLLTTSRSDGTQTRSTLNGYSPTTGYLESVTQVQESETTLFGRDAVGRLTSTTTPSATMTSFAYDAMGNLSSLTPPGRSAHAMGYSAADQLDTYTPPEPTAGNPLPSEHRDYTLHRKLETLTRADGRTVIRGYRADGKLQSRTTSQGVLSYGYHPSTGQLSSVTGAGAVGLAFGYDGSLPTSETWDGTVSGNVSRGYDESFRLSSLSVNGSPVVAYDYDDDGLLTSAGPLTLTRDAVSGDLIGSALDAVTTSETVNEFGELDDYVARHSSTDLYREHVTERDGRGRIVERVETVLGAQTTYRYGYDGDGRLQNVQRDGDLIADYSYDGNGNRLSVDRLGAVETGSYDGQDRLESYGTRSYAFGAAGDLQSVTDSATSETTAYAYDELGNLRSVTLPDGRVVEYEIDARDRRVGKKVDGVVQWRLLYQDQLEPVAMLDASGAVVATFVYGSRGHVPDYMVSGGVVFRYVVDHLGSVRILVNTTNGSVVQELEYDEFGVIVADTNPGFQPFGFAGGLYDPDTGLTRFGARDYDPVVGRWTAKDPILFRGGQENLYAYVGSDPVNRVDPSGMGWLDWLDDLWDWLTGASNESTCEQLAESTQKASDSLDKQIEAMEAEHWCVANGMDDPRCERLDEEAFEKAEQENADAWREIGCEGVCAAYPIPFGCPTDCAK